jgi:hypothetical protein
MTVADIIVLKMSRDIKRVMTGISKGSNKNRLC